MAVELENKRAAPGAASNLGRREIEPLDQGREAVRVVDQAKARGQVRRTACSRLVPSDDGELVGEGRERGLPYAAVLGGTMNENDWRPVPNPRARRCPDR
jgi:hypothetical protein